MTLEQWRSNKGLCKWLTAVFQTPEGRLLSEMMDDIHPKNYQKPDANAERELGVIYGYDQLINNLAAACEYEKPAGPAPKETFEKED